MKETRASCVAAGTGAVSKLPIIEMPVVCVLTSQLPACAPRTCLSIPPRRPW